MWLIKLKTALALEEIDTISSMLDDMPQFKTVREMEEAAYLLAQCKILLETYKKQTGQTLYQIKNTLDFLKSTQAEPPSSLNLKF